MKGAQGTTRRLCDWSDSQAMADVMLPRLLVCSRFGVVEFEISGGSGEFC